MISISHAGTTPAAPSRRRTARRASRAVDRSRAQGAWHARSVWRSGLWRVDDETEQGHLQPVPQGHRAEASGEEDAIAVTPSCTSERDLGRCLASSSSTVARATTRKREGSAGRLHGSFFNLYFAGTIGAGLSRSPAHRTDPKAKTRRVSHASASLGPITHSV